MIAVLVMGWGISPCATAEEPFLAFLEGLRQRSYFDTAVEYIDSIRNRSDLPPDVREVLDLQLGITLQQQGAASRVPEDRERSLNEAEASLRKFLAEKPAHAQAGQANSMLGELLFERARSMIWQADELESPERKLELQQTARNLIDQAKGIYQTAQDQFKSQFEAFPKFIDQSKDEQQFQRRQEAEAKYLRAWFNLVRCTYERGQTFDKGSEERKQTLIQAATMFEEIHTSRRTNQIGLHARLMMGKCFQEQDDLSRALGIYNEMLGHKSENPAVEVLKGIAQHYRLICLNDPQKQDHQLVIQEATTWIQANRQLANTQTGLGILWEKAIAEEKLATSRELSEKDKAAVLRAALNDAQSVARYPGAYREPANAMGRRLKVVLGEKDRDPRDFSTAFERAKGLSAQIPQLTDDVAKAADSAERSQKTAVLQNHLTELVRLLQLALDLRDSESDPKAVAQTRYLLSYVLLRQGKALDSVILATYTMVNDRKADPDYALNATEIAMAAAVAAWNQAPGKDRDFETRVLRDVCVKILELYPQSSRGTEARLRLGSVYRTLNDPLEAAKWYLQVPESDPQYALARISAGQSYWAAWSQKSALAAADPEGEQLSAEEMQSMKSEAMKLLSEGIQLTRQKIGDMARPSEELVAAEVSLASILNLDGDFAGTIQRLTTGGENSVVEAISVADPANRPEEGVQSKLFAELTYRLLLRAYIGTQQIDLALQTMTQLEKVGGANIIEAYTQLGIELQEELKRLQASGETERLAQVRNSFEQFLQKVYSSRNKSDYNSLVWIGETYYGLGQGVTGDSAGSAAYYSKAADAYSEIITGGLATADNRTAIELRLARCRRQQHQFEEALKLTQEILKKNAMTIDVQFEAAYILSDWGATTDPSKLLLAIQGIKETDGTLHVWGWSLLCKRLQQFVANDPRSELKPRFLDARYELSNSRRRFANVSEKDADAQRKSALAEITSFVQVFRDLDDVSFARFDRLYQDLQADLGQSAKPLERSAPAAPPAEVVPLVAKVTSKDVKADGQEAAGNVPASDAGGSGWILPIVGVSLCIGIAAGFVMFLRKPRHNVRIPGPSTAPKFSVGNDFLGSAPSLPGDLNFDVPAEPDFAALSGIGGPSRKVASTQAAPRTAARPVTSESASRPQGNTGTEARTRSAGTPEDAARRSSSSTSPKPRPRSTAEGAPTVPPAKSAEGSQPVSRPPAAKPMGTKPPAVRPEGERTRGDRPAGENPPQKRPKPPADNP
jgi:hypothetical protein